jgi:hypothetical protein
MCALLLCAQARTAVRSASAVSMDYAFEKENPFIEELKVRCKTLSIRVGLTECTALFLARGPCWQLCTWPMHSAIA